MNLRDGWCCQLHRNLHTCSARLAGAKQIADSWDGVWRTSKNAVDRAARANDWRQFTVVLGPGSIPPNHPQNAKRRLATFFGRNSVHPWAPMVFDTIVLCVAPGAPRPMCLDLGAPDKTDACASRMDSTHQTMISAAWFFRTFRVLPDSPAGNADK